MIVHYTKYRNIYLNPLFLRFLTIVISVYFTSENHYCDDGLWYSNTENNGAMTTNGGLQNNAQYVRAGYQTHYSDGTPIYESYNKSIQHSSNWNANQTNDGRPIYQAYNDNLQPTSRGYRYEMNGDTTYKAQVRFVPEPTVNQENFRVELDGNTVYAKYYSTDANGTDIYSYSNDGSTMIGLIEPTKSEIIGNGYYTGGPVWKVVDNSPTTFSRRFINKIKIGVKNHIAKSSREAIRQRNLSNEKFMNDIRRSQRIDRATTTKRYVDRVSSNPIKVRRFD